MKIKSLKTLIILSGMAITTLNGCSKNAPIMVYPSPAVNNSQVTQQNTTADYGTSTTSTSTSDITSTGTITKEQFKALAGNIKGGKDKLGELLKDVVPADDLKKLKGFSFASNSSIIVSFNKSTNKTEIANLNTELGKIIDKLPNSGEDTSYLMLNRLQGDLAGLTKKGDSVEKTAFAKVSLSAGIGASGAAEGGSAASWALGMTGTELGASGNVHLSGELKVNAEMLDAGKVKISFQGKFGAGAEVSGGAQALNTAGGSGQAVAELFLRKKVSYTFNNVAEAREFLKSEGKGFTEGTGPKTFNREDTGAERLSEGSVSISSGFVKVARTTKSWNPLPFSFSKQSLSYRYSTSESEGTVKTYSLDTKSGMLLFSRNKTTTELSVITDKSGALTSGSMSMEIDLNKITNSKDKDATIKKLVGRFDTIQKQLPKDVQLDSASIEAYIRGSVDKLMNTDDKKGERFFTPKGGTSINSEKDLSKLSQSSNVDISVSASVGIVGLSAEAHANWGNRVRLSIPLNVEAAPPPKLTVGKDSDIIIQISNAKGGSGGVGAGAGFDGGVSAGVNVSGGMQINNLRKLTDAVRV